MKIYFLSSIPCALTLGGAYFGTVNGFERFIELSPKDSLFALFTPEGALPVGFFITENLRFSPPDGCEVYLLKDGIAVYVKNFPPADFSLKVVAQQRFGKTLATVFRQGALQLSLETEKGLFLLPLSPAFGQAKLLFESGVLFIEGRGALMAVDADGEVLFEEKVLSYSLKNGTFNATMPLSDSLRRTAEGEWAITENGLYQTAFSIRQEEDGRDREALLKELVPYAFFESVLLGADYTAYLSDELKARAAEIKEFLGNFVAVVPTKNEGECGLVRKKDERLFEVAYFSAEIKDGKITDIKG
ncbi:MAG: hypothetical protein IJY62_06410 [Clostridia bacterium]|nr:hypothetical protein [Clostridia bacterium]